MQFTAFDAKPRASISVIMFRIIAHTLIPISQDNDIVDPSYVSFVALTLILKLLLLQGIEMDSKNSDRDDGYKPFDYYNPDVWSNPLFWVNAFKAAVWLYFQYRNPSLNPFSPFTYFGGKFCRYCYAPIVFQSDRKPERCNFCQKRIIWSGRKQQIN